MDKLRQLGEKSIEKLKTLLLSKGMNWDKKLYSPTFLPMVHKIFLWSLWTCALYSMGKISALLLDTHTAAKISPSASSFQYSFTPPLREDQMHRIAQRNLFNIASSLGGKEQRQASQKPCLPVENIKLSQEVSLLHTVVLQNIQKSVASLKVKSRPDILSLWTGEMIPSVGKLDFIGSDKILFRNQRTGQCELAKKTENNRYLPSHLSVLPREQGKELLKNRANAKDISQNGNKFAIKRSYLEGHLANLPDLLTQAHAAPIKHPDGTLSFKITEITPGGLFSKLGMEKRGSNQICRWAKYSQPKSDIFSPQ